MHSLPQAGSMVSFVSCVAVSVASEVWVVRAVSPVSAALTSCGTIMVPLTIAAMAITENKAKALLFPFMAVHLHLHCLVSSSRQCIK